jgi:hypothetical protein
MPVLESHRTIWPIFGCAFFWICFTVTCVLTFGINFGIDYGMHTDNVEVAVIDGSNFIIGVVATVLVIDVLVFFGGGSIRDRILKGDARPVAQLALCDTLLKRIVFFSMAEPKWKVRFPRFVAQSLLFPGLFVVLVVYMICWLVSGCGSLPSNACAVPLREWCALTECWKMFIAGTLYIINFISMHNDAQPELYPEGNEKFLDENAQHVAGSPVANYRSAAQV